jgi:glucose-1-phosphatase
MKLPVLVFDYGNVVAYFDYQRFFDRLGARLGRPGQMVRGELLEHGFSKLHARFESGLMRPDEFAERVTAPLGLTLPFEEFVREWEDIFWLNEPVARLIATLDSRGYTLILGSNTNQVHASYFMRRFAAALDRFDAHVLSYEVGCLKPDGRFYAACARAAGADPGSCVFIDDMAENVEGARMAGLQGLQYVETAGLLDELRGLGVEVASDEG